MPNYSPAQIIGRGIISALGHNLPETAIALQSSQPVLPALPTKVETTLPLPVFEIPNLSPIPDIPGGFSMQILRHAFAEAMSDAGLNQAALSRYRVGVCIGTTVACQLNDIPFYAVLRRGSLPPAEPFRNYIAGNPAEWLRQELSLSGPALTISNACSSGADAIGIGMLWIRNGLCDLVIAGGTDELNKVPLDGFNALGVCSPAPCCPFDANRAGLNLGEAAGIVILARRESAPAASAPAFAIAGFGNSADAFHITQPDPEGNGLERAINNSLANAGKLKPAAIAFINAHGTGTNANDRVESIVLQRVFGNQARFISTKALTGHTLGAAGAIECILTTLLLEQEVVPASQRFQTLAEDMPLAPLSKSTPVPQAEYALSTSLAFGGSNSALIISRIA